MKLFRFLFLSVLVSCSSSETNDPTILDDSDDMGMEENMPPNLFSLLEIANNSENIGLSPSFSWENAIDPEGDAVSYQFILDTNPNPSTILADNVNSTSFAVTEELLVNTTYYWKVVAIDENENSRESDIASFTTRGINLVVEQTVAMANFPPRYRHTALAFKNKIWIIGGASLSDVWSSTNGIDWQLEKEDAPFGKREFHTSVVFDDKIWVIAGWLEGDDSHKNDIWSSTDGKEWVLEKANAEFSPRILHSMAVFDNKIWLFNGLDAFSTQPYFNEIWSSPNGTNWTLETDNAPLDSSFLNATLVFDNKIWIIGGQNQSGFSQRVWSTTDGINWELVTNQAGTNEGNIWASVVFDNRMWLFGTESNTDNDIWYSNDGESWFLANQTFNELPARDGNRAVVLNNRVYLIAGNNNSQFKNDVWELKLE